MPASQKEPDDASWLHHPLARRTLSTMPSLQGHGVDIASSSLRVGPSLTTLPSNPTLAGGSGTLSGGSGIYCTAQSGLGGSSTITNANGNDFQLFDATDLAGEYGSYQALLQSVLCQPPSMATGVDSISDPCVVPDHNDERNAIFMEHTTGVTSHYPTIAEVDESGYVSSDSSVYDVNSDDEFFGDDVNICPDEDCNVEESNLADHNTIEELPEATNQNGPVATDHAFGNPACPCLSSNPFFHVMTEVKEDGTTPWKKRTAKGQKRSNCRVPKGMGAIEIALRNAPYRKTKYIFEPLIGLTFDSEHEAYEYYNMYSWEVGFGIKKKRSAKNQNTAFQTMRELRCLCADLPKEGQTHTKLTDCKAMIRLLRTEDDAWYIKYHVAEHNHPLTESCGEKNQWYSHGNIDDRALDLIKYLRENNVSLTKVHCILGSMYGSMDKIPVSKRSLRAICNHIARDQMDDDIHKTLAVFQEIRKRDPDFQFSVLPDAKNRIKNLLWINGKSREQYKYFGDVVTFDTTYCTNIYKMPFGLFVGVNNHFQTTIFGGVFMKDETIPSFEWVFKDFVSLMGGKAPSVIFTDQCSAMASALKNVWKEAIHLLCKWHVFKDAPSKLGAKYKKGSAFRKLFHKIINDMLTIDEFERAWSYMLEVHELTDNEYLKNLYDKKEQWAKCYFRDCFCARMSSTQRSESANHMLKRFVPRNCSMNRFILQFNKLLFARNSAEDEAEFKTKIVEDIRERAWPVEKHASKFYTAAVYVLFRKEVHKATHYFAIEKIKNKEYDVVHAQAQKKLPWNREKLTVVISNEGEKYDCECGLYQHFGVLCSHVLRVMNQLGVCEIPKAHICKRWTRSARDVLPGELKSYQQDTLCMNSMTYRHSYLYLNAIEVVDDGNKDLDAFAIVAKGIKNIQKELKIYFKSKEASGGVSRPNAMVMQNNYYTTESDVGADTETETEGRNFNSYGAAGSSAGMSDSELLKMKAPSFNRPVGRPRQTRIKGALDYFGKKKPVKKNSKAGKDDKKRKIRCGSCNLLGHSATNCKKKRVDVYSEIPEF